MTTVTTSPSGATSPDVEDTDTEVNLPVEQAVETSQELPSDSDSSESLDDSAADAPGDGEDAAADVPGDGEDASGIKMTESLWQKTYMAISPENVMRHHEAIYWRAWRLERHKEGEQEVEEYVPYDSLWAPWALTSAKLLRHWDAGMDSWEELYQVTLEGANGTTTLDLTTEHLMDIRHLNEATARAGGLAQMRDPASPAHGSAVMQFRTYLHKLANDSGAVATTNRLGRMDGGAGVDGTVYSFPDCAIGANGPYAGISYRETRPNRAAPYLAVSWDPSASIGDLLTEWLTAALDADPSEHKTETASIVSWAAASCTATRLMDASVIGGFPLLWVRGTPGSGKTARVPCLLSPFGQRPDRRQAGMGTAAQIRDTFLAACDVPWMVDEVKLQYLAHSHLGIRLLEFIKDAYNGAYWSSGGQFGSALNQTRRNRTFPSVAITSEDSPPSDQAVADRLLIVEFVRREMLAPEVASTTREGFERLLSATQSGRMAPVAGAWYAWLARTDVAELRRQRPSLPVLDNLPNQRRADNFRNVFFGMNLFGRFLREVAPQVVERWRACLDEFKAEGIPDLVTEVQELSSSSGAIGVLCDVAMLSRIHASDGRGPKCGIHYNLTKSALEVLPSYCTSTLGELSKELTVSHVPSFKALSSEIRQWPGVKETRKRLLGGGSGNARRWLVVPWATLKALDGPSKADFDDNAFSMRQRPSTAATSDSQEQAESMQPAATE